MGKGGGGGGKIMMTTFIINPTKSRNLSHSKITTWFQLSGDLGLVSLAMINTITQISLGIRGFIPFYTSRWNLSQEHEETSE